MACIALSEFSHEVAVEHCLSHLNLLVSGHFVGSTMIAARAKATNPCLIENRVILTTLSIDIW